jgi:hypothetical protein
MPGPTDEYLFLEVAAWGKKECESKISGIGEGNVRNYGSKEMGIREYFEGTQIGEQIR